jgi:hypothetical protein
MWAGKTLNNDMPDRRVQAGINAQFRFEGTVALVYVQKSVDSESDVMVSSRF